MTLKLFNYITRKKEAFRPLKEKQVGLYTCGPTVYNFAHIGNLRTYVFEDVLRRTLEFSGYRVKHVMNITDVGHLTDDADSGEDKLEEGAKREKKTVWDIARFYTDAFFVDTEKLTIERPHVKAPATGHIPDQLKLISQLLKKKIAYETATAIYFDVSKFKRYARYARQALTRLRVASRSEVVRDPEKRHPADFALWFKLADKFKNHTMRWPSPWGDGFPGWHIECSAISAKFLGQPFDIHTGGVDHIFPHHTNEIAQSEAAYGKPLARFWLEGEHLLVDGKKMSKSLGNVYRLKDLEERGYSPLDFRYLLLEAHYRKQLNFTWRSLDGAKAARLAVENSVLRLKGGGYGGSLRDETETLKVIAAAKKLFLNAIADDLNTPKALVAMSELLHYGNKMLDRGILTERAARVMLAAVFEFDRVFGLGLRSIKPPLLPPEVERLLGKREEERRKKNWKEADRIRDEIKELGYEIEDTAAGPKLRRV